MKGNGLLMDDTELAISFRGAKDPRAQIGVLADLNCASPRAVAQRLHELGELTASGLEPSEFSNVFALDESLRRGRPSRFDEKKARELWQQGLPDIEIASRIGVERHTIYKWRERAGLPVNRKKREVNPMKRKAKQAAESAPDSGTTAAPAQRTSQNAAPAQRTAQNAAPAQQAPEPAAEPEAPMTLGQFRAALSTYLTAALNEAQLYLDGAPLMDLYGFSVTTPDGVQVVDLHTRRG